MDRVDSIINDMLCANNYILAVLGDSTFDDTNGSKIDTKNSVAYR